MPSPFPGMNPYFEQTDHWLDFHTEFLSAMRRLLAPQVGPKYIVQFEEHIVEKVPFLEVRDRQGRELVTVIELLSPSNKRAGDDREQYLAKRRELLWSPAHLVEIDLLRGWSPMPQEGRPECDYSVMVSRAEKAAGPLASGPSVFATGNPSFPSRFESRTTTLALICRKRSTTPTTARATSTSFILASPNQASH